MPTNVAVPFFKPGQDITGYVSTTAVSGKHFVVPVAGGRGGQPHIATAATEGVPVMGVAGHDQEVGLYVHVNVGGVVPVVAGADIAAGARVMTNNLGRAVPFAVSATAGVTNWSVGIAMAGGAAGSAVPIKLA